MGKKSRNKQKQKRSVSGGGGSSGPIAIDAFKSNLSPSTFAPPSFITKLPVPAEGWARELKKLEKELHNTKYSDAEVVESAAKAARIMRQFDLLEKILIKAHRKGVQFGDQHLWLQLKEDVAAFKSAKTAVRNEHTKKLINDVLHESISVDRVTFDDTTYLGMNGIQYASCRGDVQLLEKLISLGAALDFEAPYDPSISHDHSGIVSKPKHCTALILAVNGAITARNMMSIVANGGMGGMHSGPELKKSYEGCVECAIQLVRLGADTSMKFQFPPDGRDNFIYRSWHMWKLENKSVRDLTSLVGSDLFTKTVEEFSTMEYQLEHVNCRCGSRLPWKLCHAGKPSDPYYTIGKHEKDVRKIKWRYSPMAPCHCNVSNERLGLAETGKIYFKCCWDETAHRVYYQCDKLADITVTATAPIPPWQRTAFEIMQKTMNEKTEEEIEDVFEKMQLISQDASAVIASRCKHVRDMGPRAMELLFHDPCSKLSSWDPEIYVGVMETMDPKLSFRWFDLHWTLPKAELLKRVDEWNEALEIYCDKIGLSGTERENVIKLHTASPFAPCAYSECCKMETRVKQYSRCSKCLSVAYCSTACQKNDWKSHKQRCRSGTRET